MAPNESDRETCQCKTHENITFFSKSLFSRGIISSKNLEEIADATLCNPGAKACAYGECEVCHSTPATMMKLPSTNEIAITQWSTESTKTNEDEKRAMITVKKERALTEEEAIPKATNTF